MSVVSDSFSEEERSLFRPFTRESLAVIQTRIAEEHAKQKELEKKRAEGEVSFSTILHSDTSSTRATWVLAVLDCSSVEDDLVQFNSKKAGSRITSFQRINISISN